MKPNRKVIVFPLQTGNLDNPYLSIIGDAVARLGISFRPVSHFNVIRAMAFHLHWPESIFWGRMSRFVTFLPELRVRTILKQARALRARNRPVVWTAHNSEPHEVFSKEKRDLLDRFFSSFSELITDVIIMNEPDKEEIINRYPILRTAVFHYIPHPDYIDYYQRFDQIIGDSPSSDVIHLSVVGKIRPYKGIRSLVEVLRSSTRQFKLTIAGQGDHAEAALIKEAAGSDSRISIIEKSLTHFEYCMFVRSSDVVIFNFSKVLNSGSVLSALSLRRPVICPALDNLSSLASLVGGDWVRTFEPPAPNADWLLDTAYALKQRAMDRKRPNLTRMDPRLIGLDHLSVYECSDQHNA